MDKLFLHLDRVVQHTESTRVLLRTNSSANDKHVHSIRAAAHEVSELAQVLSLLSSRVESLLAEIIANDTSKELAKASLSTLTTHGACSNLYSSGSAASLSLANFTLHRGSSRYPICLGNRTLEVPVLSSSPLPWEDHALS